MLDLRGDGRGCDVPPAERSIPPPLDHLPVAMVVLQGGSPEAGRLERLNRHAIALLSLAPRRLPLDEGAFYALLDSNDRPRLCQDWSEAGLWRSLLDRENAMSRPQARG